MNKSQEQIAQKWSKIEREYKDLRFANTSQWTKGDWMKFNQKCGWYDAFKWLGIDNDTDQVGKMD